MSKNYSINSVPTAFITKNKQRVKQYGTNVYLNNGDEFEIELSNPLQRTVLAKLKLNGEYISQNVLILKPGQRVFLERYFDKTNKFKFETYTVDDNNQTRNAILLNGDLFVEFYLENQISYYPSYIISSCSVWGTTTGGAYAGSPWEPTLSAGMTGDITYTVANTTYASNVGTYASNNVSYSTNAGIETGRVESGSHSNQSFVYDNKTFNNYYSYSSGWKILPQSQKPYEVSDFKKYCTECGTRIKKSSHKFCYNCGTALK